MCCSALVGGCPSWLAYQLLLFRGANGLVIGSTPEGRPPTLKGMLQPGPEAMVGTSHSQGHPQ